jgi:hypothetical protein
VMNRNALMSITVGAALAVVALIALRLTGLGAITVIMAGSALGALVLLVPALRQARTAGDVDGAAMLTFAAGWLISLPIVSVVLSGGLERRLDASRELVPVLPGWYQTAVHISMVLLMAVAAILLGSRLLSDTRRVRVHTAGLFAILLWAVAWLASGLQGGRLVSLSGVALLVCLMAATVLPRGRGACVGVGVFAVTLAVASGLLAAFQFDDATVPCRHECVLGSALTGALPNENLLGTTLLAAIPFAYLGFRGRVRTWLVLYLAGMAFVTGSRGAMLVAVVVVAALFALRPRLDADRPAPMRAAIAGLLLGAAVLASVYIISHDWSSSNSLTDRPGLWRVASDYIHDSALFGYGPDKWETLYKETGEIPRAAEHSTHNQWIDVLFNAGWIGVALLVAMMVAMLWSAGYARTGVLIALATVLLIGVTERAWSIGFADFASFSLIGLILLGPTRAAAPTRPTTEPARARPRRAVAVAPG